MRNCLMGWLFRGMALACAVAWWGGAAQAAGEWEWTQGQGWVMGAGVARPTAKEQLQYAYQLEQKGDFMDSARQYFLLVRNFPSSEEAGIGLQRLARCLFEMENYYTSYKAIEQVIQTYPNTGRMSDLVEIELRIAKKIMASQTPDLLASPDANTRDNNVRRGLEIVTSVIDHDPYGPVAAEAYVVKGEGYLYIGEIASARTAFETVRDDFPRSDVVERARLGLLRCDVMLGQANQRDLAEQIDVVREAEAARQKAGQAGKEELDEVEQSLRQLAEVEAGKMMEQADLYRRMGTRAAVQSSQFLYKEIARRYPGTPQADDANRKLGKLRVPKEEGRVAKAVKNININPFTWNKDPEPPWIVPQLNAEDVVMVDAGLGPIAGVPETGIPATPAAAGVRPANLDTAAAYVAYEEPVLSSPEPVAVAGAMPAPTASYAGSSGSFGGFSSDPYASGMSSSSQMVQAPLDEMIPPPPGGGSASFMSSAPSFTPSAPAAPMPIAAPVQNQPASRFAGSNPIPTVSESDLIAVEGGSNLASAGLSAPMPDISFSPRTPPAEPPRLGSIPGDLMNDLVGPAKLVESYSSPSSAAPLPPGYGAAPVQYQTAQQTTYAAPQASSQSANSLRPPGSQGGWTLGDDFR